MTRPPICFNKSDIEMFENQFGITLEKWEGKPYYSLKSMNESMEALTYIENVKEFFMYLAKNYSVFAKTVIYNVSQVYTFYWA